jgi:hypothetical protein
MPSSTSKVYNIKMFTNEFHDLSLVTTVLKLYFSVKDMHLSVLKLFAGKLII